MSHHHQQSFGYPEFSSIQDSSPMQSFEPSHDLYGLQTGIEMLQMMPSYHVHHGVDVSPAGSSWQQSNRTLVDEDSNPFDGCSGVRLCDSDNYELKNSVYLVPAQELLGEFCSLEEAGGFVWKQESRVQKVDHPPPLFTNMDGFELQSRKAKLFSMLEQVDGRYKRYCNQMRAVVSSFEAVAGPGSASAYAALAWKAMSRHFRGLRDGIVGQILATKMAMGERDPIVPEATKGETPRLKLLDRRIRQQKMFRQGGGLDGHPWRPQRGLPERSVTILRAWLFEHFLHPYPSVVDKHILARQAGLSRSQVSNWFINARVRLWKPMVEEMYLEEEREQESINQSSSEPTENPNPSPPHHDQKPLLPVHVGHGIGPGSPSPITVTNNTHHVYVTRPRAEDLGAVYFDRFSSYHDNNACSSNQNFGNGVSLTLGLQQSAIFFSRDQQAINDCEQVAFSGGESIAS